MKPKHRRLSLVAAGLVALAGAVALALTALEENIVFFYTPDQVAEKKVKPGQRIRLGGLVEEGSVKKLADGVTVHFRVTDRGEAIRVSYKGILPDLFREGQGVVVQGALREDGLFVATEVLAKHDENYLPPEVAKKLKERGMWQGKGKDKP